LDLIGSNPASSFYQSQRPSRKQTSPFGPARCGCGPADCVHGRKDPELGVCSAGTGDGGRISGQPADALGIRHARAAVLVGDRARTEAPTGPQPVARSPGLMMLRSRKFALMAALLLLGLSLQPPSARADEWEGGDAGEDDEEEMVVEEAAPPPPPGGRRPPPWASDPTVRVQPHFRSC
jgi:hypothetical protein